MYECGYTVEMVLQGNVSNPEGLVNRKYIAWRVFSTRTTFLPYPYIFCWLPVRLFNAHTNGFRFMQLSLFRWVAAVAPNTQTHTLQSAHGAPSKRHKNTADRDHREA